MLINISGHHVDVTTALKTYVTDKLAKLERHSDRISHADVILTVQKHEQKAEATVRTNSAELFADAIAENMYAAIDDLLDKLDRQLLKHKEKVLGRKHIDKPHSSAI